MIESGVVNYDFEKPMKKEKPMQHTWFSGEEMGQTLTPDPNSLVSGSHVYLLD